VNETLVQAIRTESSLALQHHFGVSLVTVSRWRKAFGVSHWGTPGSEVLHAEATRKAAAGAKARVWTEAERAAKSEWAKLLGVKPRGRPEWTREADAFLGTMSDEAAAHRLGTTESAARSRRGSLKIKTFGGD
jgi:hypothetical protein